MHCSTLLQALEAAKFKMDRIMYTSYIKACDACGMVEEATRVFRRMVWGPQRMRPNKLTFLTMIRVYRRHGRPHEALRAYSGMRKNGR